MVLVKALMAELIVFVLTCIVLFLPAGTVLWTAGWVFLALFFSFVTALACWLFRYDSGLLNERVTVLKPDQKTWDKVWLVSFYLLSLAWFSLMALDGARWHWSQMPLWLEGVGTLLLLCSLALIFLTVRENSYLSPTVRIQRDRSHTVITSGPYGSVRHPLYSGACLFYVGVSLLLGSWCGLCLTPIFIGLLVLRAILEERMLREELLGYNAYITQVKYRFIPHIW